MKVILLERVGRLGTIGDQVTVKNGYARNFLLPQNKAIRANAANQVRFEAERANIEQRNAERREAAAGIAQGLNGATVVMIRQASETGHLYGSVSSRDIADALAAKDFSVTRSHIDLPLPIKSVGIHQVALNLHAEVQVSVNVNVARSEAEAQRQDKGEDMSVFNFDEQDEQAEAAQETEAGDDSEEEAPDDVEDGGDEAGAEDADAAEDGEKDA
ncbi:LSU ribosomal protein L9p [hydrothermal vent metagenome]|uniref:LSU ribosomal protein L9p n=1 Tax=hydrothermal vent metagenome TaxID=652676 RepID=A0A3B0TDB0_9ZZZZ